MSKRPYYWAARFWHDWEPAYNRKVHWNWINFTLVSVDVEVADYAAPSVIEISVALLGLHFTLTRVSRAKVEALNAAVDGLRAKLTEEAP